MDKYEELEMEVIAFEAENIVTAVQDITITPNGDIMLPEVP